ncbi:MAG TPA: histidine--tRNA ligase [Candidatus Cryptobacteroides sp.]|nr:histidine--tRNA ligase [Candidatus Cryptobacteroides sp.]
MIQKPSIPRGTRDFSQEQMARRNYIFDIIKGVFASFGYAQIETPAMEKLSTLLGKYGEEGDKLLFRVLDSGDPFDKIDFASYKTEDGYKTAALSSALCERGLRYDLTVPLARFVVQHQNEIVFPFKRSQIQPVWRADRPQKGRYREFYQCDVDAIGSTSQLLELELVQMVEEVFAKLDLRVLLKINNRKVLSGLAEVCGFPEKLTDITIAIDKLEKVGLKEVKAELSDKGLSKEAIDFLDPVLKLSGSFEEKIAVMREVLASSETGLKGLDELEELFGYIAAAQVKLPIEMDLSLARGLNYYTGAILEVKALDWEIGSICGGGRYDNLTGIFGLPDVSGVGISFGADRIYDVLEGLNKFPAELGAPCTLLFANMDAASAAYVLPIASALRAKGIATEVYPDSVKLKKQFDYADKKGIPFISICGSREAAEGKVNVKNLASGEEKTYDKGDVEGIICFL